MLLVFLLIRIGWGQHQNIENILHLYVVLCKIIRKGHRRSFYTKIIASRERLHSYVSHRICTLYILYDLFVHIERKHCPVCLCGSSTVAFDKFSFRPHSQTHTYNTMSFFVGVGEHAACAFLCAIAPNDNIMCSTYLCGKIIN